MRVWQSLSNSKLFLVLLMSSILLMYVTVNHTTSSDIFSRISRWIRYDSNDTTLEMTAHDSLILLRTKYGSWGKSLTYRWKRFYGNTSCKDNPMRGKLKTLLSFWIEFAKQHQIRYALMWGTLMGIVRVNDLLPWDHDIDIIVDYRDILRLREIAEKRGTFRIDDGRVHIAIVPDVAVSHNISMDKRKYQSCSGEIVTKVVDPCSFQEPLSRVLLNWWFLDVFHYYDEGEQLVSISEGKRFVINQADMFPLRSCTLMGLVGLCPKNPLRLLENWYGEGCLDKSEFRCKDGSWQDVNGKHPKRDWRRL